MGQQQSSSEKPSSSRSSTLQSEKERKIHRRTSLQTLQHPRAQPADPSASNTNAVAQATTSHNVEKSSLQNILQSTSPENIPKPTRTERSTSRASKSRKEPEQTQSLPTPQPGSMQGPETTQTTHIDIPAPTMSKSRLNESTGDYLAFQERSYAPVSHMRPPRLPLPIADPQVPDSPTLLPINRGIADVPIFDTDEPVSATSDAGIRRRSSFQSEATQEEEDVGDELQPYATEPSAHTVPTTIEWNQPGERVFVTGTFATWEKKYRLHRRKSRDGMYCTINLPPGTHHLKFWVDSQMVTSTDLPTAVDFNNVLVNYIEISADDIPRSRRESNQGSQRANIYAGTTHDEQEESYSGAATPGEEDVEMDGPLKEELPPGDYRSIIPQYLIDIECPEEDPRCRQAAEIIQDSNGPPTLPMFLNRSILNQNAPVKDDSSVLMLPNHTVLNHLMTSSVKNGVLATSVTHRYMRKYVTTISFKRVPKFEQRV